MGVGLSWQRPIAHELVRAFREGQRTLPTLDRKGIREEITSIYQQVQRLNKLQYNNREFVDNLVKTHDEKNRSQQTKTTREAETQTEYTETNKQTKNSIKASKQKYV